MKKLGAFLAITSLLTLAPAAFAAGGDAATPSLKDKRIVREASPDARTVQPCEGQVGRAGDLRPAGLCMGPDGVLHYVPTNRPNSKLY